MNPSYEVELCTRSPMMDKFMHTTGILLLFFLGLSGVEDIIGKKCALTVLKIRQQGGRCQMK
jgi:hypothetical protein